MINKVILVGRLGKDPELRYTPQGLSVVAMSIATVRRWWDQDGNEHRETEWHNVIAWDTLAQACHTYLLKGRLVYIEGRLHTRDWQDADKVKQRRTEVIAEEVQFLEPHRTTEQEPVSEEPAGKTPTTKRRAKARGLKVVKGGVDTENLPM